MKFRAGSIIQCKRSKRSAVLSKLDVCKLISFESDENLDVISKKNCFDLLLDFEIKT